jgi:acetolactate synthase-1/2/3 large subunit
MITGAEAMVKCLEAEGITKIFGYPGVAIAPFYDGLYGSKKIEHILVRREDAAGHAASGYARISRKPAVCCTTSGPGATNLLTALATAYSDSIPMVAITGQVASDLLGRDVFQEADITGAAESFVKYSYLVKDANDIPRIFKEAFFIASTGRKGPVLIDVPVDIQQQKLKNKFEYPAQVDIRGYKPKTKPNSQQMKKVITAIKRSSRPLVCVGGGVILGNAEKAVRTFCKTFNIPVVSTMMGVGAIQSSDPLYFGMLGNNGKPYANLAVERSDLLIIVGARLADRAIPRPKYIEQAVSVIHIDIDSAEIGKNLGPMIPLVGDAKNVFTELAKQDIAVDTSDWLNALAEIRKSIVDHRVFSDELIDPNELVSRLSARMEDDAVYVADVGQNQLWSADNYVMKNGRFMTTGGMGTMGYSIPAAMGAKMAAPNKQVVAVMGDGAFQMSMQELATIKKNNVPLKILIVRNRVLGLVREYQLTNYRKRYIGVDIDGYPNFDGIAKAYDMPYFEATEMKNLDSVLDEFLACEEACIMVAEVHGEDVTK